MSDLHEALKALGHTDYADVPIDNLGPFLQETFEAAELVCNSVPPPAGGRDFDSSTPATSKPDSATSAKEIIPSDARPPEPHPSHVELRGSWGKPIKIAAKDNPLGISVYKMAGHDRCGAWFARRSVHEGLSFSKFKRAMKWEFAESMAVCDGPGAGAVRGIGGDQRLEHKTVDGVGDMDVYQLSAQFPGPTTPREFLTLLLTSSDALSEKTGRGGSNRAPRHYMVVSKPTTHPGAPERSGYIRGHYESVELIREIPLHKKSTKAASTSNLLKSEHEETGRGRASTVGFAESRGPSAKGERLDKHEEAPDSEDAELNPVEWIMITRSDPGGGIPRFMVDRGTPSSICNDAVKFFNWACAKDSIPDPDDEKEMEKVAEEKSREHHVSPASQDGTTDAAIPHAPSHPAQDNEGGVVSHLTNALEAGLEAYAPASISHVAHQYLHSGSTANANQDVESDSSDDSSSYASADDYLSSGEPPPVSTTSLPLSRNSSTETKALSSHDKEIQKLQRDREKLDEKFAKKEQDEDEKLMTQKEKDSSDKVKAIEKHDKEIRKQKEKHAKEVRRLEEKKAKELKKAEDKRKKQLDRDIVGKVSRERDDFQRRLELVQKENALLRDQIGEVQTENTVLVHRLSKLAGGDVAMRALRDDMDSSRKRRSNTMDSMKSRTSFSSLNSSK